MLDTAANAEKNPKTKGCGSISVEPTVTPGREGAVVQVTWLHGLERAMPFEFVRQSPPQEGLVLPIADSLLVGSD